MKKNNSKTILGIFILFSVFSHTLLLAATNEEFSHDEEINSGEIEFYEPINESDLIERTSIQTYNSLYSTYKVFSSPWNVLLKPYDMDIIVKYITADPNFNAGDQGISFSVIKNF